MLYKNKKNILCFTGILILTFLMLGLVTSAGYNVVVPTPVVATPAASSSGGGGGGGGGASSTYILTAEEFSLGYSKKLSLNSKILFPILEEYHTFKLMNLTESVATINISSEPQIANLIVGDIRKFDVTADNYYNIKVSLNSINSTSEKANFTVIAINEEITVQTVEEEEELEEKAEEVKEKEIIEKIKKNKAKIWWIIGAIIVFLVLVGLFFTLRYFILRNKGYRDKLRKRKLFI